MRALSASRLPLAATLFAALSVASFSSVARAQGISLNFEKYQTSYTNGTASSQESNAMSDLPTLPGGPSSMRQPRTNAHAAPPSGPKLMLPSATGVHPRGRVNQYDLHFTKLLDRASPKAPGKPAEFKTK